MAPRPRRILLSVPPSRRLGGSIPAAVTSAVQFSAADGDGHFLAPLADLLVADPAWLLKFNAWACRAGR